MLTEPFGLECLDLRAPNTQINTDRTVRSSAEGELGATSMRIELPQTNTTSSADGEDSAKRRQILNGAREVFLAQGFDAASMGEIARRAGVSKGTLYVYFKSKEELFEAVVGRQCRTQAEQIFNLDPEDHDVEG